MELVSMKCPSCNALVVFEKGQDRCFCSHCGSQIQISDPNNQKFTYTKIDAARIREAQAQESIRQRELDIQERQLNKEKNMLILRTILIAIAIIASAAVLIFLVYNVVNLAKSSAGAGMLIFYLIFMCIMVIGIIFTKNR